jgi:predicted signal transduction protein with EAL and GGDEF domain
MPALTQISTQAELEAHLDARFANGDMERALGGFALLQIETRGLAEADGGDKVAARLLASVRDTDFLARLTTGNYVLVMPQVSDRDTVLKVAQKILTALMSPATTQGCVANAIDTRRAFIGAAVFPKHAGNPAQLLEQSAAALVDARVNASAGGVRFAGDAPPQQ